MAALVASLSFTVKHGKVQHSLTEIDAATTVEELKAVLQSMSDVPADMMKLLFKVAAF
jgi:hypothetical protein